jgi:hypothetical protein
MGKGKGAKVRHYFKLLGGKALAAISRLRGGLQRRLCRFMTIRLGRPVLALAPLEGVFSAPH